MPSRSNKRISGKYRTQFDIDRAAAMLKGIMVLAKNAYGVVSIIRINDTGIPYGIHDVKHLLFSEQDGNFGCYDVDDEHYLTFDAFAKIFSSRMTFQDKFEVIVSLDLYDFEADTPIIDLLERGKKVNYSWFIESFLLLPATFVVPGIIIPPRFEFEGEELVETDRDEAPLSSLEDMMAGRSGNGADNFIYSLLEYSYLGGHSFTALWEKEDGSTYSDSAVFIKGKDDIGLVLLDDITGALEYQLLIDNIQDRMDSGEHTFIIMNSVGQLETDGQKALTEVRGWELKGRTIHSLDERRLEELVTGKIPERFDSKRMNFCDSWDYPVTRHDDIDNVAGK